MDSCVSETTSNASDDYDSEFGEDEDEICLDHVVWTKLPEELLIHIFARLPVKNILQICSLSKSWRSIITSPQFQQAFSEASLVRISLLDVDAYPGTSFFSQDKKGGCFRPNDNIPCATKLLENSSDVAGTASGLICVIDYEVPGLRAGLRHNYLVKRVFVMNMVTGVRRELPSPRIMNFGPTLVQMKANFNGGYTITFLYTEDRERLQVTSWQVYDSVKNTWNKDDDERAIANFKDVEVFNTYSSLTCGQFYDVPATFHKETKAINIFNHHGENERPKRGVYPSNVSGELYKLCTQEGRHGVWRLVCSSKWEMVCEFPDFKDVWTCLRVMNDLVVLMIKFPVPSWTQEWYEDCAHGYFVHVFHMPSKVWHNFPKDDPVTFRFSYCYRYGLFAQDPFLVEIRFDSVP